MIRLDDRVWLLWALWILLLPINWVLAAAAAALVHECSHILALWLLGGRIHGICVTPFGAEIHGDGIEGYSEILCALGGPVGSFCCVLLVHRFPVFALCALAQGLFNLLPVYPMDGGRILQGLLQKLCPSRAESIGKWVQMLTCMILIAGSIWLSFERSLGYWPVLLCFLVILKAALRKKP